MIMVGAGLCALQGVTGQAAGHTRDDGTGGPVEAETRTVPLNTTADGSSAALDSRDTRPFSMLGVTWARPSAVMAGTVEFRARDAQTEVWSDWRELDVGSGPGEDGAARGGTEPAWVGPSDGVEVRVDGDDVTPLPAGLRLDMIDPGAGNDTGGRPQTASDPDASAATEQPPIVSRADWGADESISPEQPAYLPGGKVKAAVVHHTAESNEYTCAEAPAVVRGVYTYHVKQLGWKDVGYNFLVDKCGTVYEGRKGGVDRPVLGAHAYGFNSETTGISVLGTYTDVGPSTEALTSVARLAAWKLGLDGVDPAGTVTLTAGAAGKNHAGKSWAKGARLSFPAIHGHRDGYNTECPGEALYAQLPTIRSWAVGGAPAPALP